MHQKHPKISKPAIGTWGRNEFALIGAPCEIINILAERLIEDLSPKYKVAFVDADHSNSQDTQSNEVIKLQDKITYFALTKPHMSEFERRSLLNEADIILVNGNHFQAEKQIVLIDPRKELSLKKKENQLKEVIGLINVGESKVYDWLKINTPTVKSIENIKEICGLVEDNLKKTPLKALILIGGKSSRMGQNKSEIVYNGGLSQKDYLFKMLNDDVGIETFVSVAKSNGNSKEIEDCFIDLGPYGGILSAFKNDPNSAWLVMACDMPNIGSKEISFLIENRNPSKLATACFNPETGFPDPLFTIWEPKAYQVLLQFLAFGYSCPRKVLINSEIELLHLPNPDVLRNINTPFEKEEFFKSKN